jgi:hypothetical protein
MAWYAQRSLDVGAAFDAREVGLGRPHSVSIIPGATLLTSTPYGASATCGARDRVDAPCSHIARSSAAPCAGRRRDVDDGRTSLAHAAGAAVNIASATLTASVRSQRPAVENALISAKPALLTRISSGELASATARHPQSFLRQIGDDRECIAPASKATVSSAPRHYRARRRDNRGVPLDRGLAAQSTASPRDERDLPGLLIVCHQPFSLLVRFSQRSRKKLIFSAFEHRTARGCHELQFGSAAAPADAQAKIILPVFSGEVTGIMGPVNLRRYCPRSRRQAQRSRSKGSGSNA